MKTRFSSTREECGGLPTAATSEGLVARDEEVAVIDALEERDAEAIGGGRRGHPVESSEVSVFIIAARNRRSVRSQQHGGGIPVVLAAGGDGEGFARRDRDRNFV